MAKTRTESPASPAPTTVDLISTLGHLTAFPNGVRVDLETKPTPVDAEHVAHLLTFPGVIRAGVPSLDVPDSAPSQDALPTSTTPAPQEA